MYSEFWYLETISFHSGGVTLMFFIDTFYVFLWEKMELNMLDIFQKFRGGFSIKNSRECLKISTDCFFNINRIINYSYYVKIPIYINNNKLVLDALHKL